MFPVQTIRTLIVRAVDNLRESSLTGLILMDTA